MLQLLTRIKTAITGRSALWAASRPVSRISDWGMPARLLPKRFAREPEKARGGCFPKQLPRKAGGYVPM